MSTEHDVRVVKVGPIVRHPDADSLGITEVDGRPCVVRLGEFNTGELAVYVPIDGLCPVSDPRFAFLATRSKPDADGRCRIRAAKLRGVFSMGLLVHPDPCPNCEGAGWLHGLDDPPTFTCPHCDGSGSTWPVGADVSVNLGVGTYEPPVPTGGGDVECDPGFLPVYDIESVRKWGPQVLIPGEEVVLTEKIHGANGRFAWHCDRLWCASRTQFYKPGEGMWSRVAAHHELESRLASAPGVAVYGEVYGQVQDLKYARQGANLVLFDALDIVARRWLDYDDFLALARQLDMPTVPELYRGPWSPDLMDMAEGSTVLGRGQHVREGWVLRPVRERQALGLGRVILKLHGQGFLTRKGG